MTIEPMHERIVGDLLNEARRMRELQDGGRSRMRQVECAQPSALGIVGVVISGSWEQQWTIVAHLRQHVTIERAGLDDGMT